MRIENYGIVRVICPDHQYCARSHRSWYRYNLLGTTKWQQALSTFSSKFRWLCGSLPSRRRRHRRKNTFTLDDDSGQDDDDDGAPGPGDRKGSGSNAKINGSDAFEPGCGEGGDGADDAEYGGNRNQLACPTPVEGDVTMTSTSSEAAAAQLPSPTPDEGGVTM